MTSASCFIGILSGTSMDAVDCVLADFSNARPQLLCTHSEAIPEDLRHNILELCRDEPASLRLLGETDIAIGRLFAKAINTLLGRSAVSAAEVIAIGSHGQTVQHQPQAKPPFTLQLGDPNTIAALTGITTVADFRRKDMAAGGQGAPLAPLFHQAYFAEPGRHRVLLNLGGIANITILPVSPEDRLRGFDTGPANVLMDGWTQRHLKESYDTAGKWASQGHVDEALLSRLLQEPYLQVPAPKSTGRELFNLDWLERHLGQLPQMAAVDVQASLLEFSARSIAESIARAAPDCDEVVACGGGARNQFLMQRLAELMPGRQILSSDALGLAASWVEAMAFAWLAQRTINRQPVDCRDLTGAAHPCVLGGIYYSD